MELTGFPLILALAAGAAALFFWVWGIADCLLSDELTGSRRLGWLAVVILLPLVGTTFYRLKRPGHAETVATTPRFRGPWVIAASFLTFGISTGFPYYNIAFFFDYFRDDHSWTQAFVTQGAPLAVLLTIWAGPIIVPKVSPRLLVGVGTGLTFIAFQWFGRLSGANTEYYVVWCLYMLGYFIAGPIPHQIIISNWYKRKRGLAMGLTYVGVAIVGAIGNKVGPYLAAQTEYTGALQTMSFVLLLAWPFAFFVLRDKPEQLGQLPDGGVVAPSVSPAPETAPAAPAPQPQPVQARSFGFLMSKAPFWLLLIGSAASIGSIAAVNFLMKFVFEEQGFTDQAARDAIWSDASFAILLSSIGGRLLAGQLADQFPRKYVMLATYVVVALAIPSLFLVTPETPGFVYVFAVVFGFAMGADYMLIPLMAADQFGLATLAKAMSAILPSDTISQFWFPRIVAELREIWGGYGTALWAVFGMAALGAAAIGLLPRHHKPVDED